MTIDTITQSRDYLELADIDFHPLVRAKLQAVLQTESRNLEQVAPDRLLKFQGRIEVLRWILADMLPHILEEQRTKAKAAEAKNDQ
jgi:hypothetical protein